MAERRKVLIAGIGGASLGTEILKSLLLLRDRYAVFGCDIMPLAYGHYQEGLERTFVVDRDNYIDSVLEICDQVSADCVVPGGEEPMVLLAGSNERLADAGVKLACNSPSVVALCSDKGLMFEDFSSRGTVIPLTVLPEVREDLANMTFPCVVKPRTASGGSSFVFIARSEDEALLYVEYLSHSGKKAIVQEYISPEEGEFTIGVLSLPDGTLFGSVAMKRLFHSKLSVLVNSNAGIISSGYSQGLIDDFPQVRRVAEEIAISLGSTGPLNVQGRVKDGVLVPFEVNPRFSASTYLRAMAGFNEVGIYLGYILDDVAGEQPSIKPGYYLRSLDEVFVPLGKVQR